jgi:5'-nucleotidase
MASNRRTFLKQLGAGGAYLTLAGSGLFLPSEALAGRKNGLTILHTNDMHSRIEPFPNDGRSWGGLGGMARRATLIRKIREEEKNVLLLDSGDIWQGTPYFNFYGGELEFKLMTEMGYDLATLGNHDFDAGLEGLEKQLPHAGFDFVSANYDFSQTRLKEQFKPYKVFEKGKLKVGIFGLGIELSGLVPEKLFAETRYLDPLAVAREMVQQLKQEGCHFIICLSHLGYQYESEKIDDVKLASQVEGIDLILGGHTHTFLEAPVQVNDPAGKPVLINQVGWAGIKLGRLDFSFSSSNKLQGMQSQVLSVEEEFSLG